jgi:RNA polymerase sigma-70 factor (ECF subfamily)
MDVAAFQTQRPTLFAIAYRMLGSASEAEDVLQDAYLRYASTPPDTIRSLKSYLATIVSRLCLDRLKAARTLREQYIGPWLPEPILTPTTTTDLQQTVELHESVTLAFLVLLESLTPHERAVFLLHEVFEYAHDEIAEILAISAANSRQIFSRAKKQLVQQRPRFQVAPERQRQLAEGFLAAVQQGNLQVFTNLLAEEVVFRADGGGKVPSATRPVVGRRAVTRLLAGLAAKAAEFTALGQAIYWSSAPINGEATLLFWVNGTLDSVWTFRMDNEAIITIDSIRNPEKLAYVQRQIQAAGPLG